MYPSLTIIMCTYILLFLANLHINIDKINIKLKFILKLRLKLMQYLIKFIKIYMFFYAFFVNNLTFY